MSTFRMSLIAAAALVASISTSVVSASGGSGGGGTSGGGSTGGGGTGGGGTNVLPQVVGTWIGAEQYLDNLGSPVGAQLPMSFTIRTEDASGNLTGIDNRMGILITGKASSNGAIVLQDGAYYGQKISVDETGQSVCADGSAGRVLTGKFQRKEGSGSIMLSSCPAS